MKLRVQKTISKTIEQSHWIRENNKNLSQMVQTLLDQEMNKDRPKNTRDNEAI